MFLDRTIWEAFRLSHLPYEKLPALVDFDEASHLRKRSFKYLDVFSGAKRRHPVFGLLQTFSSQYAVMTGLSIVGAFAILVSPLGMYKLLE
jgi:hypothetical protein